MHSNNEAGAATPGITHYTHQSVVSQSSDSNRDDEGNNAEHAIPPFASPPAAVASQHDYSIEPSDWRIGPSGDDDVQIIDLDLLSTILAQHPDVAQGIELLDNDKGSEGIPAVPAPPALAAPARKNRVEENDDERKPAAIEPRAVYFGKGKHEGNTIWRHVVARFSGDRVKFPCWNDTVAEQVREQLKELGVSDFYIKVQRRQKANSNSDVGPGNSNGKNKRKRSADDMMYWRKANEKDFSARTRQRFNDDRRPAPKKAASSENGGARKTAPEGRVNNDRSTDTPYNSSPTSLPLPSGTIPENSETASSSRSSSPVDAEQIQADPREASYPIRKKTVCLGWTRHHGTIKFCEVVRGFSDDWESFPNWRNDITDHVKDKLAGEDFLVFRGRREEPCKVIDDGLWVQALEKEINEATKMEFDKNRRNQPSERHASATNDTTDNGPPSARGGPPGTPSQGKGWSPDGLPPSGGDHHSNSHGPPSHPNQDGGDWVSGAARHNTTYGYLVDANDSDFIDAPFDDDESDSWDEDDSNVMREQITETSNYFARVPQVISAPLDGETTASTGFDSPLSVNSVGRKKRKAATSDTDVGPCEMDTQPTRPDGICNNGPTKLIAVSQTLRIAIGPRFHDAINSDTNAACAPSTHAKVSLFKSECFFWKVDSLHTIERCRENAMMHYFRHYPTSSHEAIQQMKQGLEIWGMQFMDCVDETGDFCSKELFPTGGANRQVVNAIKQILKDPRARPFQKSVKRLSLSDGKTKQFIPEGVPSTKPVHYDMDIDKHLQPQPPKVLSSGSNIDQADDVTPSKSFSSSAKRSRHGPRTSGTIR